MRLASLLIKRKSTEFVRNNRYIDPSQIHFSNSLQTNLPSKDLELLTAIRLFKAAVILLDYREMF